MKKLTIVHGPHGCGKTLNAPAIMRELQQWESFTAVLSGPNFDTFAQERSV